MKLHFLKTISAMLFTISLMSCSSEENRTYEENRTSSEFASKTVMPATADKIKIGSQIWMSKNLNVSHYRNGDGIPQVTDPIEWANLTTGAWCYNNNNIENGQIYGKLYNWYAVNDSRGLAPIGYHIPDRLEYWSTIQYLGGANSAAKKMKSTNLWIFPNVGATNQSGFTAFPSGYRVDNGDFQLPGPGTGFWTNTEYNLFPDNAHLMFLSYNQTDIVEYTFDKNFGMSVRCLKD
jgi:uncharacterized protein (TIGR02145 family)